MRPDASFPAHAAGRGRSLPTSIARTVALTTVWDLLLDGELTAAEFVRCATGVLMRETSDSVIEPVMGLAVQAARLWSPDTDRDALMASVADTCLALAGDGGARRVVALRALAGTAVSDEQLATLRDMVGDDIDLGWRTLTRLASLDRLDPADVTALEQRDPDPEAWARAVVVDAARPVAEAKESAWALLVDERSLPLGSVAAAGNAFWQPTQADLLAPYADRYLESLPALREAGMLSVLGTVVSMFPLAGVDDGFVGRVTRVANGSELSPMIAQRLLEQADRLQRMLRTRAA